LASDCIKVDLQNEDAIQINLDIELNYENEDIKNLINQGLAEYVCEYDCSRTNTRRCFKFNTNNFSVSIPRKSVVGKIDFLCFIAAKENIPNYKNKGFNEDYQGFSFDLERGDVLAIFPEFSHDTDIKYDKLHAAGSIMVIVKDFDPEAKRCSYNFDDNKIEIRLPEHLFELYQSGVGNSFAEIIHASMAYNALVCALSNIDRYKDKLWAKTILYRLQTEDNLKKYAPLDPDEDAYIDSELIADLATDLLDNPYERLINSLYQIVNNQNAD
jgi:hypothetical protein